MKTQAPRKSRKSLRPRTKVRAGGWSDPGSGTDPTFGGAGGLRD